MSRIIVLVKVDALTVPPEEQVQALRWRLKDIDFSG